jgi:DNA invertase Pin-like site-specific DNA recombinase
MDSGVEFVAVDNPHATRLTLHILAAVAEHERAMISERTKAALTAAKARGKKLGGPKLATATKLGNAANADRFAANVAPIIRQVQKSGATTLRAVAAALAARRVERCASGERAQEGRGVTSARQHGRDHCVKLVPSDPTPRSSTLSASFR